ncbi:unnamed protein product [Effrenium voratum]|uniref:Uncharacterized protein n=1 Tax=Effrenium voratum TaxID=2562239 RepID=A0AA36JS55_9DINO|nr:unnamed protein product [Effrenium voratum]CAJ1453565.1 unnamed protein product [Effrenium voratum]
MSDSSSATRGDFAARLLALRPPATAGEKPDLLSRPCDARRSPDRVAECLLLPGKLSGPKAEASELMALAFDGAVLEREMAKSRLHVDLICCCPPLPWKPGDATSEIQLHGFWRVSVGPACPVRASAGAGPARCALRLGRRLQAEMVAVVKTKPSRSKNWAFRRELIHIMAPHV